MRIFKIIGVLAALALSACASTHPGRMGTLLNSNEPERVVVSADVQSGFSDEHYTFVTVTVENKTDKMVRIKSAELNLDKDMEKTSSVIVGNDLVSWAESFEEAQKVREHNKGIMQAALMLGGAALGIAGAATDSKTLRLLGVGTLAAGASWEIGSTITSAVRKANNPAKVPENHLYAPFSVPAGGFIRKWVVIQKPMGAEVKLVNLDLNFDDETSSDYEIALN